MVIVPSDFVDVRNESEFPTSLVLSGMVDAVEFVEIAVVEEVVLVNENVVEVEIEEFEKESSVEVRDQVVPPKYWT